GAQQQLARARMGQAQADDLEGDLRVRCANRHLVQAYAVVTLEAEPIIAGERQDEAARDRMPGDHRDGRLREREQAEMRIPVERTQPARGRLVAPRARQVEARAEERTR